GLGTERSLVCLVTLDLPGDKLDLPALAVEDGKLLGRGRHRVEQVGDQPVELGMTLAPVFDDPDLNRLALAEVDQVTAVPQLAQRPPSEVALDPPEQVGSGRGVEQPKPFGRKAAIGQHDHSRLQRVRQLARQGTLTLFVGAERDCEQSPGAALDQAHQTCMGHPYLCWEPSLAIWPPNSVSSSWLTASAKVVPSMATTRRPRQKQQSASSWGSPKGLARAPKSFSSTSQPSRIRAFPNAERPAGDLHFRAWVATSRISRP